MPPSRTLQASVYRYSKGSKTLRDKSNEFDHLNSVVVATGVDVVDLAQCESNYPSDDKTRQAFRTNAGKTVTAHQWAVYDFVRTIPVGKVTTYKDICVALGQGSPRSVGNALRNNPFAPFVPCHRIIASNHYIGGFLGEWGPNARTGTQCNRKLEMLAREGVGFSQKGYLLEGESGIWRG